MVQEWYATMELVQPWDKFQWMYFHCEDFCWFTESTYISITSQPQFKIDISPDDGYTAPYRPLYHVSPREGAVIASAECILVTGSRWECLRVVGPESQGGKIPEFTGLIQWPSGAPGRTSECQWQAWERQWQDWEHLGALVTTLKALATSLCACRITAEQSGKNIIICGNTAGVPGNHSYYLLFNNC